MGGVRQSCLLLVLGAAAIGLGSCGDDEDTAESGGASGGASGTVSGTADSASGTAAGLPSCEMATSSETCAVANSGFCKWIATSFVPEDLSSCSTGGGFGGVCVDFATADGCHIGNCGTGSLLGGGFAIFYRPVEGGFEVARTTDCNPMTPDFAECPFSNDGTGPAVCECACYAE